MTWLSFSLSCRRRQLAQIDVDDLILLNPWTILGRYPDDVSEATVQEGEASAAAAGRVLDAVSTAVGG